MTIETIKIERRTDGERQAYLEGYNRGIADGRKREEGRWVEKEGWDGDVYYDCSICGESWATIDGDPWNNGMKYCPNCGAFMGV